MRLPNGWVTSDASLDARAAVQLTLGRSEADGHSWRYVTIRPDGTQLVRVIVGDTVSGLAESYGISQAALLAANPQVADPSLIHPGESLVIPAFACPVLPVDLATVMTMTGTERLACFGNRTLTFTAYGRGVAFAEGPCAGLPGWPNSAHHWRYMNGRSCWPRPGRPRSPGARTHHNMRSPGRPRTCGPPWATSPGTQGATIHLDK